MLVSGEPKRYRLRIEKWNGDIDESIPVNISTNLTQSHNIHSKNNFFNVFVGNTFKGSNVINHSLH